MAETKVTPNEVNAGAARSAIITATETTTSTSYTDLTTTTDTVTVVVGASGQALVILECFMTNNTGAAKNYCGVAVSGASTIAATDQHAKYYQVFSAGAEDQSSYPILMTGLTPGSNTFKMKYRVDTGGGGAGTGSFKNRTISVIPI